MKVVFVIAKHYFRDEELFHTLEELKKNGIDCVIASSEKGDCIGSMGKKAVAELSLEEINSGEFNAVIFVGGSGASVYFENEVALDLARSFFIEGKLVAAICIAPSILANAGILKGKTISAFPSEEKNLLEKGAFYSKNPVEVDGQIITANGPGAAREFGKKISESLA